ncbi:cell division protein FtsX [Helicobacter sp. 23-1044]
MRIFRQYLSLLIPLIALLIGIESIILASRALNYYEHLVGKNYAIVIVSNKELKLSDIKSRINEAHSLFALESQSILEDITKNFKDKTKENLQNSLPFFYSLKLSTFPNQSKITQIESALKNINGIYRVESFSKTHNQTYRLLVLLKGSAFVLSVIIMLLSLLLMIKQVEVWRFEHSERMEIMTYFGASAKMKNAPLYKLALISSLLATSAVIAGIIFASKNAKISAIMAMLGIDIFSAQNLAVDSSILAFSAYTISMIAVFVVILFQKEP